MIRTFKYPIRNLSRTKEEGLLKILSACQQLYNTALEQRIDSYRKWDKYQGRQLPSLYNQQKELTQLRRDSEFFGSIGVWALRSSLARLDKAFQGFFRRCKSDEKPGFPRFRSRDRYDSFEFPFVSLNENLLRIPSFGQIRLNLYRPIKGVPKQVTIRRDATGKWWACITCDLSDAPIKSPPQNPIGIDLGLTHFITLSNSETISNPRCFRDSEELLARRQRSVSRKKKGSRSRQRAKRLVAKTHRHIADQRLDHARKIACQLFNRFDLVCYENLKISNLVKGSFLSKSISDAAWKIFIQCLQYKAESAGKWAIGVDPRGTSQKCSDCQTVVRKELKDRIHNCPNCGIVLDRDHNAALNVKRLGLSQIEAKTSVLKAETEIEIE